jgi:hypothetical protein
VSEGFNSVLIALLCDQYAACPSANGTDYAGDNPFTSGTSPSNYDLSTPNPAYFSAAHTIISEAQSDGLAVFLDPIGTDGCQSGGWITTLENNGDGSTTTSTKDYQYGAYLGTEFGDLKNVVWTSGNDFQCVETSADNNDALAVVKGIKSTDPTALQTVEMDYCGGLGTTCEGSSSIVDTGTNPGPSPVDTGWGSSINLNGAYTYAPAYAEDLTAYGQSPTMPMFLMESNYEAYDLSGTDGCSAARNCRLQEWWTMTSGGAGQLYGGPCFGITVTTILSTCDTTGAAQLRYETNLLSGLAWYDLVPDSSHTLVTSGYGTCPTTGSIVAVNCVTTAQTPDKTLAISYLPDPGGTLSTITVNLANMAGATTARWYDPTNGTFQPATYGGTTSAATFTPPGPNSAGDSDWVLVLQSPAAGAAAG